MTAKEKLVLLRKQRNLKQCEVAQEIGVSTSTIAMMETGERKGSDEVKIKLSNFYGVTVQDLFFSDKPL